MKRRRFFKETAKRLAAYALPIAAGGYYSWRIEPEWLRVQKQTIYFSAQPLPPDGLRIAQLSDIHLLPFVRAAYIRKAVALANATKPGLVVLTGDYADEESALPLLSALMADLHAPLGVYAVAGNHDLWPGADKVRQALQAAGVNWLDNTGTMLEWRGVRFYLAGLADGMSGSHDIGAALQDLPAAMFCIMLAHEPDIADEVAAAGRVQLQLSGHSHGGQVRLPFIGAPVLPPLAKRYPEGLYKIKQLQLYTSRGVGLIGPPFGPPVRFNCRPEINLIELRAV